MKLMKESSFWAARSMSGALAGTKTGIFLRQERSFPHLTEPCNQTDSKWPNQGQGRLGLQIHLSFPFFFLRNNSLFKTQRCPINDIVAISKSAPELVSSSIIHWLKAKVGHLPRKKGNFEMMIIVVMYCDKHIIFIYILMVVVTYWHVDMVMCWVEETSGRWPRGVVVVGMEGDEVVGRGAGPEALQWPLRVWRAVGKVSSRCELANGRAAPVRSFLVVQCRGSEQVNQIVEQVNWFCLTSHPV